MAAIDWNNLNCGRVDLNHSERFFEQRHIEHERIEDIMLQQNQEPQQQPQPQPIENGDGGEMPPPPPLPPVSILDVKETLIGTKPIAKVKGRKTDEPNKDKENHIITEETVESQTAATVKAMEKLVIQQGGMGRVLTTSNPRIARLQNYASKYNKNKQDLIEKKKKEEEKNKPKPFKARPVPKYLKSVRKSDTNGDQADGKDKETGARPNSAPTSRASSQPRTLPPSTKPVLRARSASAAASVPSMITRSKAKQVAVAATKTKSAPPVARVKPSIKSTKPAPLKATRSIDVAKKMPPSSAPPTNGDVKQKKFVAKVPSYLKKEPFKVKLIEKKPPTEVKPFNFGMTGRVETRQQGENNRRKALQEKTLQAMEEKRKREEEELKEIRKKTQFKARGNPFSSKVVKKTNPENGVKVDVLKSDIKSTQ